MTEKTPVHIHLPRLIPTCVPPGWKILGNQYVGSGVAGDVYRACLGKDCNYVAKVIHTTPDDLRHVEEESRNMWILGQKHLSPRFQTGIVCNDLSQLKKIITDEKDFDAHRSFRQYNTQQEIQFAEQNHDQEEVDNLRRRFYSPQYAVLFSNFVPHALDERKRRTPNLYEKPVEDAVRELVRELSKLKFQADFKSDNVHAYPSRGKWIAKLVDVGFAGFGKDEMSPTEQEEDVQRVLQDWFRKRSIK
jgi:hypothetical protein